MPRSSALTAAKLGIHKHRDAAALPAGTVQTPLFTVSGGRVMITSIVGRVTTVVQNQVNNTKLIANPTVGVDVDLCAVTSIQADAVGILYGVTGVVGDAMLKGAAIAAPTRPLVVPIGTIDILCSATNTGATEWDVHFMPLDSGATIAPA